MLDGAEYYYSSTSDCLIDLGSSIPTRKKSRNKRRFSDEQIRSLEVTFESETKLEPRKKAELAKELGLQPRQVAIWFQNKRARWKSKQTEKDYSILLAKYNSLASHFEALNKENQSLLLHLQKLKNEVAGKSEEKNDSEIQETEGKNTSEGESGYTKMDFELEVEKIRRKSLEGMHSDDEGSIKTEFLGLDEENELLKLVERPAAETSLTSSDQDWGSLDSDDLVKGYQWWDFWS